MASDPFFDARRGTWHMKVKLGGMWKKIKIGDHGAPFSATRPPQKPPPHIKEAQAQYAEAERLDKLGLPTGLKGRTPLKGYVERYLAAYDGTHRPNSTRLAELYCRDFVAFAAEQKVATVEDVSRSLCRDYLEHSVGKLARSSVNTQRGYVGAVFARAVDDEIIAVSPWRQLKTPGKATEHIPCFWTEDEIRRIVDACSSQGPKRFVLLAVNTGIRSSALAAMEWSWVKWQDDAIVVPAEHDKAGKGYRVPIFRVARDVLQEMAAKILSGQYVFPHREGHMTNRIIRYAFDKAVAKSRVPTGTLHDLRHTFARFLVERFPLHFVQSALGHASITMTQKYVKFLGPVSRERLDDFGVGGQA